MRAKATGFRSGCLFKSDFPKVEEMQNFPDIRPPRRVPRVIVAGAVNMDLSGTPFRGLRPGDSNPGRVRLAPGGVGRNIAENLARLGLSVSLLTILGDDLHGQMIRRHSARAGIDLSLSLTDPDAATSTYLCINEPDGDLHIAVSDMSIYDRLLPDRLEKLLPELNRADLVVMDANLPEETLVWLARQVQVPLAADPVSAAKASRLKSVLPRLTLLKPNVQEAEILTGIRVRTPDDALSAARALLDAGLRRVFLSLGPGGALACGGDQEFRLPCYPAAVRNTTGCGDAFFAAVCDAFLRGMDLRDSALRGLAAAALCAQDENAVPAALSQEALSRFMNESAVQN